MFGQDITSLRRQIPDVFFSSFFIDMSKNALKMSCLPYLKGRGSQTDKSRALPESQHHKQLTVSVLNSTAWTKSEHTCPYIHIVHDIKKTKTE